MIERYDHSQAVKTAIENDDYEAFKKAAGEKKLERLDSEEEFNKLVENNKKRQEFEAKILAVVKDNNFEAYKTVV